LSKPFNWNEFLMIWWGKHLGIIQIQAKVKQDLPFISSVKTTS